MHSAQCWEWTVEERVSEVSAPLGFCEYVVHLPGNRLLCGHNPYNRAPSHQLCRNTVPKIQWPDKSIGFCLLFRLCQILVSWLQIKLSPQTHFLSGGPLLSSVQSLQSFTWLCPLPSDCVKAAPLVRVFQQNFHLGCQDPVSFLQVNWKKGRMCPLGFFFFSWRTPCAYCSSLWKHTKIEVPLFGVFWKGVFQAFSALCPSTHDSRGRGDGSLRYKPPCLWVIFGQQCLRTTQVWRGSYLLIGRGHLGIRTLNHHQYVTS